MNKKKDTMVSVSKNKLAFHFLFLFAGKISLS